MGHGGIAGRNKGFTLVEMLVALAIFSGLMLTLFSAFNAFVKSGEMIKERGVSARESAPDIMISDLEQIYLLQPPRFRHPEQLEDDEKAVQARFELRGAEEQAGGETVSALSFASQTRVQPRGAGYSPWDSGDEPASAPQPAPGITRITYYVHETEAGLDLLRADHPAWLPEQGPDPCTDPILFRDITSFAITYFDRDGERHETWDSGDEEYKFRLPDRLLITITRAGQGDKIRIPVFFAVNREVPL